MKRFCFPLLSVLCLLCSCGNDEPKKNVEIQDITLITESLELNIGESKTVEVSVSPEGAKVSDIVWESNNIKVCSVDQSGVVTALAAGKTSVSAKYGTIEKVCIIKVAAAEREYELVWEDNFNGSTLNTDYWNVATGYPQNNEKQYYTDKNFGVSDGYLIIEAKKESCQGRNYTSSRLTTKGKVKQTYGKFEAMISFPAGSGTWPAFWMMPNDNVYGSWPLSGEIDIVEHWGSDTNIVSHAVHTKNANGGSSSRGNQWKCQYRTLSPAVENNFHLYAIEWVESYQNGKDAIFFYVDGKMQNDNAYIIQASSSSADWPFNKDFYVILNLALGGNLGGTIDDAIFDNQVLMKVDYVKVYKQK